MTTKTLIPWGMIALYTEPGKAIAYRGDDSAEFDLDSLGELAEWLAVAWQNVAGEEYKPVAITAKGYVLDEGILVSTTPEVGAPGSVPLYFGEGPDRVLVGSAKLERDCE